MNNMSYIQQKMDDIYSKILKFYLNSYYWKIGRADFRILKKFEKYQFFDQTEIYEWKFKKIKKLLWFCSNHVPYYQNLFNKLNINIQIIKDIETYQEVIPILSKSDILKNFQRLKASNIIFPPIIKNSTGGSTGQPMNFLQDRYELSYGNANALLNLNWCGWNIGEKRAYLWGAERDFEKNKFKVLQRRLENNIFLNSFYMDKNKMTKFYYTLEKFKPKIVIGYANSLYIFAKFLKKYNLHFHNQNYSIQSSAETLFPVMRETIESAFQAKIFNSYGSREVPSIAHECNAHDGLHINELINHLEIVNQGVGKKDSNSGRLILTSLINYVFPLLRYENGDIGELKQNSSCKCGRKFKKLEKILGRTSDFIQTPSNKIIHGEYFTHLLYSQNLISKFQVIQDSIDNLNIIYIAESNQNTIELTNFLKKMENKIKEECDSSMNIAFQKVDEIKPLKSGKHQFILSNLKSQI